MTNLIEILARSDALFEPQRGAWDSKRMAAVVEARRDFFIFGLPIGGGGGDSHERKQAERMRSAVERSGLVEIHRTNGRRTHWRLTNQGDWILRGPGAVPPVYSALLLIERLDEQGHHNAGFVPEWAVALSPDENRQTEDAAVRCAFVAEIMLPALVRRWATSWADPFGAVGYKITASGRHAVNNAASPVEHWPDQGSARGSLYTTHIVEARHETARMRPKRENALAIPLGGGDWPSDETRGDTPSIFTPEGKIRQPDDVFAILHPELSA